VWMLRAREAASLRSSSRRTIPSVGGVYDSQSME
jgi:hypothetical protein